MSEQAPPRIGAIAWHDLAVADAPRVRDFYAAVTGWTHSPVSVGDYEDFCMHDAAGEVVAGVCHARGVNAGIPTQWLMYIAVEDVERSAKACAANSGEVIVQPRSLMGGRVCVIRDPAGAVCALWQSPDATK